MHKALKTGFCGSYEDLRFLCGPRNLTVSAEVSTPANYGLGVSAYQLMVERLRTQAQLPAEELADKLSKADAQFNTIKDELVGLIDHWMEVAGEYWLYAYAQELESVTYPPCTMNAWVPTVKKRAGTIMSEEISNHAFSAEVSIEEEDTSWRSRKLTTVWYASYYVAVNLCKLGDLRSGHIIKSTSRRKFVDKDKALAYIAGRKATFDKSYFSSLDPVITKEFRPWFLLHGVELPGYTYAANSQDTNDGEEM